MPVSRRNATVSSPRAAPRAPAGNRKPAASHKRPKQSTPSLHPSSADKQPSSARRLTRSARARSSTPAVDPTPQSSSGLKRKASSRRPATPPLEDQENLPSNLRPAPRTRSRSRSLQPSERSAPPSKRARAASRSPAPATLQKQRPARPTPHAGDLEDGPRGACTSSRAQRQQAAGPHPGCSGQQQPPQSQFPPGHAPSSSQQAQQSQPQLELSTRPSATSLLTSMGPQPSESLRDSILKSPSPPRRTASTRTQTVRSLNQQLGGGVVGAALQPIAAFGGDQPAVDQPPPHVHHPPAELSPAAQLAMALDGPFAVERGQGPGPVQDAAGGVSVAGAAAQLAPSPADPAPSLLPATAHDVAREGRGESPNLEPNEGSTGAAIVAATPAAAPGRSPQQAQQAAWGCPEAAGARNPLPSPHAERASDAGATGLGDGRLSISPGFVMPHVQPVEAAGGAAAALGAERREIGGPSAAGQEQLAGEMQEPDVPAPQSSADRPSGSVRFSLPPPGPPHGQPQQQQQQQGVSPRESNHTQERSTARQGGSPKGQGTPISKRAPSGLETAASGVGDPTWFDPGDPAKVREACAVLGLGSCRGGPLVGREREVGEISGFLHRHLTQGVGGSLYVSGLPGTGKTLTVHELVRRCHPQGPPSPPRPPTASPPQQAQQGARPAPLPPPALISINCMSLMDPNQVVARILGCFQEACATPHPALPGQDPLIAPSPDHPPPSGDPLQQLQKIALAPMPSPAAPAAASRPAGAKRKAGGRRGGRAGASGSPADATAAVQRGMLVVVLDEIDGLLAGASVGCRGRTGQGSPLLDLLVLAHQPRSRLVLIGIANDLNLVQKIMPDVRAQCAASVPLRPLHVVFTPYQRHQVSRVLAQRLSLLPGTCFDHRAVEMCARKMGNGNGDMRLALEACSKALALLSSEAHQAQQAAAAGALSMEEEGPGEGGCCPVSPPRPPPPRLVGMRQMATVLNSLTGGIGTNNAYVQAVRGLPPQQQLIMCAVAKLLGDGLASKGTPLPKTVSMTPASSKKAKSRASFMSPSLSGRSSASSIKTGGAGGGSLLGGVPPVPRSRDITMAQLYEVFTALSQQIGFWDRWDPSLFYSVCDNLDGLITISKGANPSMRRVTMKCHEDDVVMGVADTPQVRYVVGA